MPKKSKAVNRENNGKPKMKRTKEELEAREKARNTRSATVVRHIVMQNSDTPLKTLCNKTNTENSRLKYPAQQAMTFPTVTPQIDVGSHDAVQPSSQALCEKMDTENICLEYPSLLAQHDQPTVSSAAVIDDAPHSDVVDNHAAVQQESEKYENIVGRSLELEAKSEK